MFNLDCSRYPTEKEGLKALMINPGFEGWNGPYLKPPNIPKDSWGQSYFYFVESGPLRIVSSGPDKTLNTSDDIVCPVSN